MVALAVVAAALALPTSGVAVQSNGAVRLYALDGRVAGTLPGWRRIAPAFGTPSARRTCATACGGCGGSSTAH